MSSNKLGHRPKGRAFMHPSQELVIRSRQELVEECTIILVQTNRAYIVCHKKVTVL